VLLRLRAMALLLVEHASSYAELGAAAAAEYRRALIRKLVLLVIGALTCVAGLAALWTAGLIAVWDTGWRLGYAVGSALVLLAIAGASFYCALARQQIGPSGGMLRSELRKDMELFRQWKATL
jgi:uncharacterized membrane protein YqjE